MKPLTTGPPERELGPSLLVTAILLLMADMVIALGLRGLLRAPRRGHGAGPRAAGALAGDQRSCRVRPRTRPPLPPVSPNPALGAAPGLSCRVMRRSIR